MYRTLTVFGCMCRCILLDGIRVDNVKEKADAKFELGRGALESGIAVLVRSRRRRRIRHAPVDRLGVRGKLRTDFSHAVAERDHVVELLREEFAQMLAATTAKIDSPLAHYSYCVRMQRLGLTTGTENLHIGRKVPHEGLSHLRPRTVARAQEQNNWAS